MKIARTHGHGHSRGQDAFTMVEIALSLAVAAFAMVAILGVLPTGLQVQRDNRQETIINADGAYLMEALRTGNDRLGLLTNIYLLTVNLRSGARQYIPNDPPDPRLTGQLLLGLLGTPRNVTNQGTSNVVAWVRALNSTALDKDPVARDSTFNYQVVAEIQPFVGYPPSLTNALPTNQLARINALQSHLYEVRLSMQWPLIKDNVADPGKATVGTHRRTFRELVAGSMISNVVQNLANQRRTVFYLQPSTY